MTNRTRLVVHTLLLILLGAHAAFAQGASTWFLAEGANNATFTQEIEVGNPGTQALEVTVTLLPQADAVFTTLAKTFAMPATSRLTVRLGPDFGLNGAASARVSAVVQGTTTPANIVVERTMSFSGENPAGSHNASGVPAGAASMTWILAEGANGAQTPGEIPLGLETFVLVANPNATPTEVRATYLTSTGITLVSTQTAPANSRVTFWPRAEHAALGNAEFSTIIDSLTSGNAVVAERAMYFDNFRSGHDALGVTAASPTWYFAEGFTGGNASTAFETFLLLVNPGTTPTTATVDYLHDSGAVISRTYALAPRERFTVWVDQEGRESDPRLVAGAFGMRVTAPVPIVAERAMYWGTPSAADPTTPTVPWREGHATAGITTPAAQWAFGEGQQGLFGSPATQYDTFFQLANPQGVPVAVQATFVLEDGTGIVRTVCVAPHARADIWTAQYPELSGQRFAAFLTSVAGPDASCPATAATPFVAERALYAGAGFESGHANVGTPWTGPIGTPPPPCPFALTPMTADVAAPGESRTANLTIGCNWTASTDVSWLVLDSAASGTGDATLSYHAVPNQSSLWATQPRTGHLRIGRPGGGILAQITVTQAGAPRTLVDDPGEAGDATVAGVDSNHDGVRDDVERTIAMSGASTAEQAALGEQAAALQEFLQSPPEGGTAVDQAREVLRTIDCAEALDAGARSSELVGDVLDTFDRSNAFMDANRNLAGEVFPAGGSADVSSCSAAVTQALPAAQRAALMARSLAMSSLALEGPVCVATPAARPAATGPLPAGWTQVGSAGTNTAADGDVSLPPGFTSYQWVSTNGGVDGAGRLRTPTGEETTGSFAQTPTFTVAAGDKLTFYFNYITTDGDQYTEYAWAGLFSGAGAGTFDKYLFTARTTTEGNTVPGFGLPGLGAGVTLTPATTGIIAGPPTFSPLGIDSDSCFGEGCGHTGWVQMTYTFTAAGTYSLGFGVTNALDEDYQSAFAVAGVTINDIPIPTGPDESATLLYVNGMTTTFDVARNAQRAALEGLKAALTTDERPQLDGGDVLLVGDGGFLSALLATAKEKGMNARVFWRTLRGLSPAPAWFQDRFAELASHLGPDVAEEAPLSHLERVRDRIRSGKRVILVAHSQGNFFANALVDQLTDTERRSARIVSVGNPDSRVAGGAPYTTLQQDLVVNAARALRPSTLAGNISNAFDPALTDANGWHGFLQPYMSVPASRARIVAHMVSAFRELVRPVPTVGSGVITVTMSWGSQPDIDLHVTEPNGTHVYYGEQKGPSGFLDVDDTDGFGPEHYYVGCGLLETGTYLVGVNYYSGSGPETATIQIEAGGQTVRTFRVPLDAARGAEGDDQPIHVAAIIVTRDPVTGEFSYTIR